MTNILDRKHYDIGELGLSARAANVLYSRQADAEIVNRLLESPFFPALTHMIVQYFG